MPEATRLPPSTRSAGSFRDALLEEWAAGAGAVPAADDRAPLPRAAVGVEVAALVQALDDEDPAVTAFAASVLGQCDDALAFVHLARLLGHAGDAVAEVALRGLARLRGLLTPAACSRALQRAPWLVRAAGALVGDAPAGAGGLLTVLLHDGTLADAALAAAQRTSVREAVPLLVAALRDHPPAVALGGCLRALGAALAGQPHPRTQQALQQWVRRVLGAAAVPDLGARLQRALGAAALDAEGPPARQVVAAIVRAIAHEPLATVLVLAGCQPELQPLLRYCPVTVGVAALPELHAGLASPARGVRLLACRALGALGAFASAPWIEELLQDGDDEVRAVAACLVARFEHHPAVPALVRRLRDPSATVRDASLLALCQLDAEVVSISLLCECLGDDTLRSPALAIMRVNPHPAQRRFIESCLADRRARVRRAAVAALARQPEGDRVAALEPLLADPSPAVRTAAAAALGR